jgi:hypothetical protein
MICIVNAKRDPPGGCGADGVLEHWRRVLSGSREADSKVRVAKSLHSVKQSRFRDSADAGEQIDRNEAQLPNAQLPIIDSCEPVSKVTRVRTRQPAKQCPLSTATEDGRQSDGMGQAAKAESPMCERVESHSHVRPDEEIQRKNARS